MKPLLVLARIVFIGCLWSIVFIEAVRVFMLQNWHFDIFWPVHWAYVWNLWSLGWVIDTPKEWAFVLLLAGFVPLWLTGWVALSLLPWEKWFEKGLKYPLNLYRSSVATPIKVATKTPVVVKKRSYKEIRPKGTRAPIYDYSEAPSTAPQTTPQKKATITPVLPSATPATSYEAPSILKEKAVAARETFSHSLFDLDDDEDDFDLDFDSLDKLQIDPDQLELESRKKNFDNKPVRTSVQTQDDFEDFDFDFDNLDKAPNPVARAPERVSAPKRENARHEYTRESERVNPREYTRDNRRREDNERNSDRLRNNNHEAGNKQNTRVSQSQSLAPAPKAHFGNPVADILSQKGYDVLAGQTIRNTIVDFIGVSENKICLCLIDKEPGDWLADEERFNNEEPLWFSESSHRISPVRKVNLAKQTLIEKLEEKGLNYDVEPYVVIQVGNIINAEDMLEIWNATGVEVTRINRGSPKEIKLFSKSVSEAEVCASRAELETIRKIIRNAA